MNSTLQMNPDWIAKIQNLLDRQAIFDCLTRVSRGIDRFDRESFLSGYHPDAVIDAGSLVGDPVEVFDKAAALHAHGQSTTLHNLMNHSCEIDRDTAHSETYFLFTARNRDETNWAAGGRYIDRLERRDDVWKIAFRCTRIEWSGLIPGTIVPLFENVPDLDTNGIPSRGKDDPSYRRPLINRRALTSPSDVHKLSSPHS